MATFQATDTYLIECSRENSLINQADDETTNGSWSNQASFNVKRGDRLSVEMVCANIKGSGTGAPTIEFSGQNVVVNGENKGYCDTKVLIEVFFTLNNNNVYSVGLPLIHPRGGINGVGAVQPIPPLPQIQDYTNLVMPFNLNPRVTTNQMTNQVNNYRELNEGWGYVSRQNNQGELEGYIQENQSYIIYQYEINGIGWQPPGAGVTQALGGYIIGMRILPYAATSTSPSPSVQAAPFDGALGTLFTDYDNGILKGRTQNIFQNNFYVGNHVFCLQYPTPTEPHAYWVGQISAVNGINGEGAPLFGIPILEIRFNDSNNPASGNQPAGWNGRKIDYAPSVTDLTAKCAVYVGEIHVEEAAPPTVPPTYTGLVKMNFDLKAGSSQEGLINYDNLDLTGIPLDNGTDRTFLGNGYMRGNNAHFIYARNTRAPQLGQGPNLNMFPHTEYNPIQVTGGTAALYTTTAGEYGNVPEGANFGYRNANIQQECNNNPYIFMRNDHFGSGRLGMNGEEMPKAMPMTAFIYVSIEELLQDVNSLTAVINERLRETLGGFGTTINNTTTLNSSILNPVGRKPASSVVPYYNKVGYYDPDATVTPAGSSTTQAVLMTHGDNCQYRNEMTDVIPVKNGGTLKICPANGTPGRDYLMSSHGKQNDGFPTLNINTPTFYPSFLQLQSMNNKTYLREILMSFTNDTIPTYLETTHVNHQGWANPFYGNMATADLYKYMLGDRYARLPIDRWDAPSNEPINSGTIHGIGKACIMNTHFTYALLDFKYPHGANNYLAPLGNQPMRDPKPLPTTQLWENQLIYTNIPFPTNASNNADVEERWRDLARATRKYEQYNNNTDTAPRTFRLQEADYKKWVIDGDIGQTDDRSTAQLRTIVGQPRDMPPNVYPETGGITDYQNEFTQNIPMYYDWLIKPDVNSHLPAITGSALYPTGSVDYRKPRDGRALICPTTSHEIFAGVSATGNIDEQEKFKMLKELGRIKLKSKFNKDYYTESLNYTGIFVGATAVEYHDQGFLDAKDVDTSFMEELDLAYYPYIQKFWEWSTSAVGVPGVVEVEKVFCALAVGINYWPNVRQMPETNIGALCWGNQIGISNSFYDNHAIIPMNNDLVKRGSELTGTTSVGGKWVRIGYAQNIENTVGAMPPLINTLAFTSVPPPDVPNGGEGGDWDFSIARQGDATYTDPADGKCKYRITYRATMSTMPGNAQGIWKQNTDVQDTNAAALLAGYEWVSGDAAMFDTPSHPNNKPFRGLMLNPNQNTSTIPWLLCTPTPNNNIGLGNVVAAPPIGPGFPAWMGFGTHLTLEVQNPNLPTQPLQDKYLNYQPGGLDTGGSGTAEQFGTVELEIWQLKVNVPDPTKKIPVNLGLQHNKVNYIWTGASEPTFQYDPVKGRVEFIQLQDDNILNNKSIPYAPLGAAATNNSAAGTAAGIINSASEDAIYSRNTDNTDFGDPISTTPIKNSGIRAEIGGVGIFNIWLCPENYEPPPTINLSSYWSNENSLDGTSSEYWNNTEKKRAAIIGNCVEASSSNWNGSLFARLGFQTFRELMPVYGKQSNRFNPNTYNTTNPEKIHAATKPLILCNAVNNAIMPALNTYYNPTIPAAPADNINGVPMFSNGFINNESVAIDLTPQPLTASSPPILSTSPFLLIESDICQTNYQSGRTGQNVLFYLMKNYSAASFIYGYGSSYTHTANQDRTISLINTAFRDPVTGRIQKCSNNSTIIYKIQRDIIIPPPLTDANGEPLAAPPPSATDELLEKILGQLEGQKGHSEGTTGVGGTAAGKTSAGIHNIISPPLIGTPRLEEPPPGPVEEPGPEPPPRPRRPPPSVLEILIKAATEGDAGAQYKLGIRYANGQGVGMDLGIAREWLMKSAEQGNTAAAKVIEQLDKHEGRTPPGRGDREPEGSKPRRPQGESKDGGGKVKKKGLDYWEPDNPKYKPVKKIPKANPEEAQRFRIRVPRQTPPAPPAHRASRGPHVPAPVPPQAPEEKKEEKEK